MKRAPNHLYPLEISDSELSSSSEQKSNIGTDKKQNISKNKITNLEKRENAPRLAKQKAIKWMAQVLSLVMLLLICIINSGGEPQPSEKLIKNGDEWQVTHNVRIVNGRKRYRVYRVKMTTPTKKVDTNNWEQQTNAPIGKIRPPALARNKMKNENQNNKSLITLIIVGTVLVIGSCIAKRIKMRISERYSQVLIGFMWSGVMALIRMPEATKALVPENPWAPQLPMIGKFYLPTGHKEIFFEENNLEYNFWTSQTFDARIYDRGERDLLAQGCLCEGEQTTIECTDGWFAEKKQITYHHGPGTPTLAHCKDACQLLDKQQGEKTGNINITVEGNWEPKCTNSIFENTEHAYVLNVIAIRAEARLNHEGSIAKIRHAGSVVNCDVATGLCTGITHLLVVDPNKASPLECSHQKTHEEQCTLIIPKQGLNQLFKVRVVCELSAREFFLTTEMESLPKCVGAGVGRLTTTGEVIVGKLREITENGFIDRTLFSPSGEYTDSTNPRMDFLIAQILGKVTEGILNLEKSINNVRSNINSNLETCPELKQYPDGLFGIIHKDQIIIGSKVKIIPNIILLPEIVKSTVKVEFITNNSIKSGYLNPMSGLILDRPCGQSKNRITVKINNTHAVIVTNHTYEYIKTKRIWALPLDLIKLSGINPEVPDNRILKEINPQIISDIIYETDKTSKIKRFLHNTEIIIEKVLSLDLKVWLVVVTIVVLLVAIWGCSGRCQAAIGTCTFTAFRALYRMISSMSNRTRNFRRSRRPRTIHAPCTQHREHTNNLTPPRRPIRLLAESTSVAWTRTSVPGPGVSSFVTKLDEARKLRKKECAETEVGMNPNPFSVSEIDHPRFVSSKQTGCADPKPTTRALFLRNKQDELA